MKAKEIREKTEGELIRLEDKLRQELAGFKIQARAGQLAETSKIGAMKKDIARILTFRRQNVTVASASGSPAPSVPTTVGAIAKEAPVAKPASKPAPKAARASLKKTEGRAKK